MDTKRQKLLEGQSEMDEREDRIIRLPDSLIHRILCFLPTKSVVRSSILSKKWRSKWMSIPNLAFRNWRSATTKDVYLETDGFMNFMDRILLLRATSKLKKFYLQCDELCYRTRVNAWISDVVKGIYGRNSEIGIGPVMPPILFSKLKKVRFGYFEGHEKELILVELEEYGHPSSYRVTGEENEHYIISTHLPLHHDEVLHHNEVGQNDYYLGLGLSCSILILEPNRNYQNGASFLP